MSHRNDDHSSPEHVRRILNQSQDELIQRMTQSKQNTIAAGNLHGDPILEETQDFEVRVRKLPDDPATLRISIGGDLNGEAYLVYRGDKTKCYALVSRALAALATGTPLPPKINEP